MGNQWVPPFDTFAGCLRNTSSGSLQGALTFLIALVESRPRRSKRTVARASGNPRRSKRTVARTSGNQSEED